MKLLFLDDDINRQKKFRSNCPWAVITTTADETITALQRDTFTIVSLDHDLGGEVYVDSDREDTGMGVVRWIVQNLPKIELIIVHSLNDGGRLNMESALKAANYTVIIIPFTRFETVKIYEQFETMRLMLKENNDGEK